MKTMISVTLDAELVEALRKSQEGISQTINKLLQEHVFGGDTEAALEKKIDEIKNKIERLEKEKSQITEKLRNKPKFTVRYT